MWLSDNGTFHVRNWLHCFGCFYNIKTPITFLSLREMFQKRVTWCAKRKRRNGIVNSFKFTKKIITICREFSNERTRVERRETFRKLRMKENFSKAFEGYFQWIIRAGEQTTNQHQSIANHHTTITTTSTHWFRLDWKFPFLWWNGSTLP